MISVSTKIEIFISKATQKVLKLATIHTTPEVPAPSWLSLQAHLNRNHNQPGVTGSEATVNGTAKGMVTEDRDLDSTQGITIVTPELFKTEPPTVEPDVGSRATEEVLVTI